MPGFLTHLITGRLLFVIGRYGFRKYFDGKIKEKILLAVVCLSLSVIPDLFLGVYYTTHILPFDILVRYHILSHFVFSPMAAAGIFLLIFIVNKNRRPIWFMGLLALMIHIIMDLFFPETGVLF